MKERFIYKFSDDNFYYYRDNTTLHIVKVPDNLPSYSDKDIEKAAIDAEDDDAVFEFYS